MSDPRLTIAADLVADFSVDPADYRELDAVTCAALGITGDALRENAVYSRGEPAELSLHIQGPGRGNRIFLNQGLTGTLRIGLTGNNGAVFLGRDALFADQQIGSRQDNDLIVVGNDVATTGPGHWVSGLRAGTVQPALLIGDSCLLSRDVVLRNTDGHPVFDASFQTQNNSPRGDLVLEPHVWLCERCAVLKSVRIGAFSIVGFGAVVSQDVPRHHLAQGNPAQLSPLHDRVWAWDADEEGISRAREFLDRYPPPSPE